MKNIIVSIIFVLTIVSTANGWDPPFGLTISMAAKDYKVTKDQIFDLRICLVAYDNEIYDLKMNIEIPPEVEKLSGESNFEGRLRPKQQENLFSRFLKFLGIRSRGEDQGVLSEKCIQPLLKARTNIEKWRQSHRRSSCIHT